MKAVLESLHSYLGRFSENRKPSNNPKGDHALDAPGYGGGYGFPLLVRRSKGDQQEKQLSRKGKTGPSSRRRCMHCRLTNSEPNLSPPNCSKSSIRTISSPASSAARMKVGSRSMGLRDCLVEMYSGRRVAARTHAGDQPFDKHSSEYYSACGKKRAQNQRSACEFSNVDCACGVDVSAYCSESDTDVSSSSCVEDNAATQVSDFSIILAENKALINNCYHCISEATPNFNTNDDADDAVKVVNGECDAGFCSHESDEEESSWDCGLSALSLSPARRSLKKKFPPPLTMLALQSYSPEVCAASHCLRSFRQDGRIVLQEVRAPIHKYFRVLREHGRLKLELVSAADDSSQEDDETSASDVCVGVERSKASLDTEELYTSHMHAENTCEGTLLVSMHSETSRNGGGSDIGCVRMDERISAHKANIAGIGKALLEQVDFAASDIQSRLKLNLEAADLSGNVGASADEQMLGGKLLFTNKVGAEELVSCLNEPASSPRCVETTTLYDGPSARMKHSWVRQISAF